MQPHEAVGKHAALKVGAKLALDEASNGHVLLPSVHQEALELIANHFVKKRLFRRVALIFDRVGPARDLVQKPTQQDRGHYSAAANLARARFVRAAPPGWTDHAAAT